MDNRTHLRKKIALLTGAFFMLALCYKLFLSMSAIHYISYQYDQQLSATIRQAIEKQVALTESDDTYQAKTVVQEVRRLFPHLKSVSLHILPYHVAELIIMGYQPVVTVNSSSVLTEQQTIIPKEYYAWYAVDRLPRITVSSLPTKISDEMMEAVHRSIKEQLFDHFIVQINRDQEWYLKDKHDSAFTICCNASSLPLGTLYKTYETLKKETLKKSLTKTAWLADLRFNHQIVLSRSKGGHNGKSI